MKTLQVIYHGQLVGELHQTDTGRLSFNYTEAWLSSDNARQDFVALSVDVPLAHLPRSPCWAGIQADVQILSARAENKPSQWRRFFMWAGRQSLVPSLQQAA